MLSEKSKEIINNSSFKEIYETMMIIPHNKESYKRVCNMCQFINSDSLRIDINIVDEIFSDFLDLDFGGVVNE